MGSPSRNVQYHPPRLSEDRLNLPQPHSPSLPYTLLREIGNAPAQDPRQRKLVERDLPPVGAPADHHLEQLLHRRARAAKPPDDPPRLAVERHRPGGAGVEYHAQVRLAVNPSDPAGLRSLHEM